MASQRRGLIAAAVALSSALVLAACGSGDDDGSSGGKVELSFWNGLTGPDRPAVTHLVDQFNKSQSKIHISMSVMPWDVLYQKLLPAYGAHKGPDIVGMDSNQIPVYASKGVLQPVDPLFDKGVQKSTLVAPAVAAGRYDGKTYGVPIENTPVVLYYNKKLFKAAGLDPNSPPTTWAQWSADAKKLTIGGGGGKPTQYGIAFGVHDTIEVMPILMWQAGGGIVSDDGKSVLLDNAGSKQAVSYWSNLIATDHVSPLGLSGADADKLFQAGKAAMQVNGPWATTGYKQAGIDYGLAGVPTGPNGKQITLGNTTSLAAGASLSSTKMQALATFYSYWIRKDSQTYFALHTGFPPLTTTVPTSALQSNPDVIAFAKQSATARGLAPGQPSFASIQNEVFDPTLQKIMNDPGSADGQLGSAATQVKNLLATGR
ncbi:carbohydrate ABC transporter substrate-binding protein, CUT1 family [Jatrophihabitans endophyticus]|uniref:Carbohydrate ABC transporter substrate-binding protein, CUT1 family n=1 Tax=Jatrophihabitans endophyticus TaxID=1206085 RepID=A0A1M5DG64_9ACTN|nr:ABC transporter substrate-binding protein [Jatrophihabitans endophyticus]SHF65871.1 carbohydrate ABC transporter substrate-binding protein, CUT1 family [Jatrophihabitans endophyticus]